MRPAITRAIIAGVSSPGAGSSQLPCGLHPLAFFVELADDARAHVVAPVVELFLQLVLDDLPLFLDHQDFLQAFGEVAHASGSSGHGIATLNRRMPMSAASSSDAEVVERLAHVEVALAAGDDAQGAAGANR